MLGTPGTNLLVNMSASKGLIRIWNEVHRGGQEF